MGSARSDNGVQSGEARARVRETIGGTACKRAGTDGFKQVGHLSAAGARGGTFRTHSGFVPFGLFVAVVGWATGDQLHKDKSKAMDIGPRARGTKAFGKELLRGAIRGGKRGEPTGGASGKLRSGFAFLHGLGDAEVEDLELHASRGLGAKEVSGFDIPVGELEGVGKGESVDRGGQQMDRGGFVVGGNATAAVVGEDDGQVAPVEPLKRVYALSIMVSSVAKVSNSTSLVAPKKRAHRASAGFSCCSMSFIFFSFGSSMMCISNALVKRWCVRLLRTSNTE